MPEYRQHFEPDESKSDQLKHDALLSVWSGSRHHNDKAASSISALGFPDVTIDSGKINEKAFPAKSDRHKSAAADALSNFVDAIDTIHDRPARSIVEPRRHQSDIAAETSYRWEVKPARFDSREELVRQSHREDEPHFERTSLRSRRPANEIEGPPTITPQAINAVLRDYHSPAAGMGQYIYDQGVKHGINPAVALAFFVQESSCGTRGIAAQNHSWGNIRGNGHGGFKHYRNFKQGLDDWYRLIQDKYLAPPERGGFGCTTLKEVIRHYAPSSDHNDEQAYCMNVNNMVGRWSNC